MEHHRNDDVTLFADIDHSRQKAVETILDHHLIKTSF